MNRLKEQLSLEDSSNQRYYEPFSYLIEDLNKFIEILELYPEISEKVGMDLSEYQKGQLKGKQDLADDLIQILQEIKYEQENLEPQEVQEKILHKDQKQLSVFLTDK